MRFRIPVFCALAALVTYGALAAQPVASDSSFGFFRYPATDGRTIVFTSEGDLWLVPLAGGMAVRLTTAEGEERFGHFSPDGKWIAFSGQEDAQDDIYLVSASGGEPHRLTFNPERDQALGWDKAGNIVFRSFSESPNYFYKVFTIPPSGGWPQGLPLDKCAQISYEPNGPHIAFTRYPIEFRTWKHYQGGWAQDVWVGNLQTNEFKNLTEGGLFADWEGSYAFPMWHTDGRIYFVSDRDGRNNIYSILPDGTDLKQHTHHDYYDVRFPSLGNGIIVYQNGMDIWALNIASGKYTQVPISLPSDRAQARVKFVNPMDYLSYFQLAPDAKRLLLCSRGELFTAPVKGKGLIRQLTFSSGSNEKFPEWSPDGKTIAAWSDRDGREEKLFLFPAEGGDPKLIGTDSRGWHFPSEWSPDGKRVAYGNQELELVVMDVESGKTQVVDKGAWEINEYRWSPDSRFLAYTRPEENYNRIVRIWDSKDGTAHNVTDDFFSSYNPAFDPEGKYLYLLSDRVANPYLDGQEMTYVLDHRTQPFAVSLLKATPSPFAPLAEPRELDEDEPGKGDKKDDAKKNADKKDSKPEPPVKVDIDFDGIGDRVAVFPVVAGNYFDLRAVKGKVFFMSAENEGMLGTGLFDEDHPEGATLHRFDIKKQKTKTVGDGILGYDISRNGEKMVVRTKDAFTVIKVDEELGGGGGPEKPDDKENKNVDFSGWDLRIDTRAEWQQMFYEAWRLHRDFFWDSKMHGVDWMAMRNKYGALAHRISTREELNDLIGELISELNCSHTYVWGGDIRRPKGHSTGLLGVDVSRDPSGFYRIDRIIAGRPWMPNCSSPLAAPGIDAKPGDYIVAINGRPTASVSNYLELLLDKADQVTAITLNSKPALDGGREVIVKPLATEHYLRHYDWVDNRRAYVTAKTDGKIGYIHLSDMGSDGLSQFTQDYLPQHNKPALIMDVRYNGGGFVAPMILSHLARQVFSFGRPRHGTMYRDPNTGFYGYLAAVCNGETGSDGETFTEGFKRLKLGPVIGSRTWGGWIGIRGDKPFVDNGMTTEPEFTGWGLDRKWLIEGWGTDPDISVPEDPAAYTKGQDPQLDRAIKYLTDEMAQHPMPIPEAPPVPDRSGKKK